MSTGEAVRVWIVSDPMCSWCWGMAGAIDAARTALRGEVAFGLLLGGINLGADRPLTDALLPRFRQLWRDVSAVTGQAFCGHFPPAPFVYNSRSACRAVAAYRAVTGEDALDYLAAMQRAFFGAARDVGRREVQLELAALGGAPLAAFRAALDDPELWQALEAEFEASRQYGTQALPSTLIEVGGHRSLLAGGYLDAPTLLSEVALRVPPGACHR